MSYSPWAKVLDDLATKQQQSILSIYIYINIYTHIYVLLKYN